jgi:hypothetical protein
MRTADFDMLKGVVEAAQNHFIKMVSSICEIYIWYALFCDFFVT